MFHKMFHRSANGSLDSHTQRVDTRDVIVLKRIQSPDFCTYWGTIDFMDAFPPDGSVLIYSLPPKAGDTLTATVAPVDAEVTYKWTINGKGAVTTETYEVPADANSGDAIKVTVTDSEGNTAEDTVYVGGFTILKVEPTTASTNNSYKYIRAYFSTSLDSLSTEDIVIRAVKSQQLYSVESVDLSSDGTYADITIAGDASVASTRFLSAGMKYGCTVNYDGDTAYLEFELPIFWSDLTVTAVDLDEARITVIGSGRNNDGWNDYGTYEIGDIYEGNLGSLVGRHVNMNINSDDQVTDFYVQDETVVIGAMEEKHDNANDPFNKYYFKDLLTDKKYYCSNTNTSSNNFTQVISAIDGDEVAWAGVKYDYVKLVLNPNGSVATAVLEEGLPNAIICTSNDEGKITQDVEKAVDLSSYTVEKDGDYIDAEDIEEGDIIFYNTTDKFADVFNYEVSGTIGTVYSTKVDIDDTTYDWVDYTGHEAQRFDADNLKYVDVTEKWLLSLDDEEDTTLSLNRRKQAVFVDGTETGVTVTTNTDYVVVKASTAYADKGEAYMNVFVSDGSEYSTIPVKVTGLKKWDGDDVTITLTNEAKGGEATLDATSKTTTGAADVNALAAKLAPKDLITVTTKDSDGSITAIAHKTTSPMTGSAGGTQDKSLEPADSSIKTAAGSYSLLDNTKIWILNDPGTSGRVVNVTLKDFDNYTNTTIAGNTEMAKVGVYANTSNKTAVDSIVIDNSASDVIKGGNVAVRVNGIIVGYETGLNVDDQTTYELKKLTAWIPSSDGGQKVTYAASDFANQIKAINGVALTAANNDTNILDSVAQLTFDADGLLLFVSTDTDGVADGAAVALDANSGAELADSNSASQLVVDVNGTPTLGTDDVTLKLADDALVLVKKGAKNYAVTTISDINLKEDVTKNVYWHQTLGTTTDQIVDVLYVTYTANTVAPVVTSNITITATDGIKDADHTVSTKTGNTLKATYAGAEEIATVQWYVNNTVVSGATKVKASLADLGNPDAGDTVFVRMTDTEGTIYDSDVYTFVAPVATAAILNKTSAVPATETGTTPNFTDTFAAIIKVTDQFEQAWTGTVTGTGTVTVAGANGTTVTGVTFTHSSDGQYDLAIALGGGATDTDTRISVSVTDLGLTLSFAGHVGAAPSLVDNNTYV